MPCYLNNQEQVLVNPYETPSQKHWPEASLILLLNVFYLILFHETDMCQNHNQSSEISPSANSMKIFSQSTLCFKQLKLFWKTLKNSTGGGGKLLALLTPWTPEHFSSLPRLISTPRRVTGTLPIFRLRGRFSVATREDRGAFRLKGPIFFGIRRYIHMN